MIRLTNSPWGEVQSQRQLIPGVHLVSTAGHGGVYLEPDRVAEMPAYFGAGNWLGSPNWYEEDCDWAFVAVVFPDAFPGHLETARRTLATYQPELLARFDAGER